MKTLEDLLHAEMKNLYAMEKQIQQQFVNVSNVEDKKLNKRLEQFQKTNVRHLETIKKLNTDLSINPGSTTDSVAEAMLENITDINGMKLKKSLKDAGMLASCIRLATYVTANYQLSYNMVKGLKMKSVKKALKKMMKRSEKQETRLKKLAEKSVFKSALGS